MDRIDSSIRNGEEKSLEDRLMEYIHCSSQSLPTPDITTPIPRDNIHDVLQRMIEKLRDIRVESDDKKFLYRDIVDHLCFFELSLCSPSGVWRSGIYSPSQESYDAYSDVLKAIFAEGGAIGFHKLLRSGFPQTPASSSSQGKEFIDLDDNFRKIPTQEHFVIIKLNENAGPTCQDSNKGRRRRKKTSNDNNENPDTSVYKSYSPSLRAEKGNRSTNDDIVAALDVCKKHFSHDSNKILDSKKRPLHDVIAFPLTIWKRDESGNADFDSIANCWLGFSAKENRKKYVERVRRFFQWIRLFCYRTYLSPYIAEEESTRINKRQDEIIQLFVNENSSSFLTQLFLVAFKTNKILRQYQDKICFFDFTIAHPQGQSGTVIVPGCSQDDSLSAVKKFKEFFDDEGKCCFSECGQDYYREIDVFLSSKHSIGRHQSLKNQCLYGESFPEHIIEDNHFHKTDSLETRIKKVPNFEIRYLVITPASPPTSPQVGEGQSHGERLCGVELHDNLVIHYDDSEEYVEGTLKDNIVLFAFGGVTSNAKQLKGCYNLGLTAINGAPLQTIIALPVPNVEIQSSTSMVTAPPLEAKTSIATQFVGFACPLEEIGDDFFEEMIYIIRYLRSRLYGRSRGLEEGGQSMRPWFHTAKNRVQSAFERIQRGVNGDPIDLTSLALQQSRLLSMLKTLQNYEDKTHRQRYLAEGSRAMTGGRLCEIFNEEIDEMIEKFHKAGFSNDNIPHANLSSTVQKMNLSVSTFEVAVRDIYFEIICNVIDHHNRSTKRSIYFDLYSDLHYQKQYLAVYVDLDIIAGARDGLKQTLKERGKKGMSGLASIQLLEQILGVSCWHGNFQDGESKFQFIFPIATVEER